MENLFCGMRMDAERLNRIHPLKLAFVGDAVLEYYIRLYLVSAKELNNHKIAMLSSRYVKASAQNFGIKVLKDCLSEAEWDVVIRGRNQNPKTVPKHASVSEYRYATGMEALLGYLHMKGETARVQEIVTKYIEEIERHGTEQHGIE